MHSLGYINESHFSRSRVHFRGRCREHLRVLPHRTGVLRVHEFKQLVFGNLDTCAILADVVRNRYIGIQLREPLDMAEVEEGDGESGGIQRRQEWAAIYTFRIDARRGWRMVRKEGGKSDESYQAG